MNRNYYQSWNEDRHAESFSAYTKNLAIYNKYYLEKFYHNLGIGLRLVLPFVESANEIGPGGGRTYAYFLQIVKEMGLNSPSYLGYEISQQCVYYLQTRYGDHWALQDVASPSYRTADLLYFYDVLLYFCGF